MVSEVAVLGGGCFWCLEAVFQEVQGVQRVVSGYAGGQVPSPTYEQVCAKNTGHAEVVRVTFAPALISFREILEVFFVIHDPTTLNCQGNDAGTQYRSGIYFHSAEQQAVAEQLIAELTAEKVFRDPIVTEVVAAQTFYIAEDYHQEYFAHNSEQPYCQYVVAPKLAKFRQKFAARLKS